MIGSHIIPKFYLEQFATRSGRGKKQAGFIWVYEGGKKPRHRGTSVQGVENGYFGFMRPDGSLEEAFEEELAKRENECNEVLVCAKSPLFHWPRGSREKLAFYAALLYSRATQRRTFSEANYNKIISQLEVAKNDRKLIKDLANALTVKTGRRCPESAVLKGIDSWLENARNGASPKNAFLATLLENTSLIADALLQKIPWRVLKSLDGLEFVTSDNPLITFVPLGNGKLHPGYGFRKKQAIAAFALAPTACLAMGDAWRVPETLDAETVTELNEAVITICDRYVYSKTLSAEVETQVAQFGGTMRYGKDAFLPIGVTGLDVRQFLRTRFGLSSE